MNFRMHNKRQIIFRSS